MYVYIYNERLEKEAQLMQNSTNKSPFKLKHTQ